MLSLSDHKDFVLEWNNAFPLDRWYRKKYNIAFNSKQHREISYIDIFYEWAEEKLLEKYLDDYNKQKDNIEIYKTTGKWLQENTIIDQQDLIDKFDKLDISIFNNKESLSQ